MWEMGGWAAEEPASAFLQSSVEDVTFGRWLPEQAPGPQQAPPEGPAQHTATTPSKCRCTPLQTLGQSSSRSMCRADRAQRAPSQALSRAQHSMHAQLCSRSR